MRCFWNNVNTCISHTNSPFYKYFLKHTILFSGHIYLLVSLVYKLSLSLSLPFYFFLFLSFFLSPGTQQSTRSKKEYKHVNRNIWYFALYCIVFALYLLGNLYLLGKPKGKKSMSEIRYGLNKHLIYLVTLVPVVR